METARALEDDDDARALGFAPTPLPAVCLGFFCGGNDKRETGARAIGIEVDECEYVRETAGCGDRGGGDCCGGAGDDDALDGLDLETLLINSNTRGSIAAACDDDDDDDT